MSRKTEHYVEDFKLKLQEEAIKKHSSSPEEMLKMIFKKVIEYRRKDRQFLAAIQSELFANPGEYMELVKKYHGTGGVQEGFGVLLELISRSAPDDKEEVGSLDEKKELVLRAIGLLLTYQIIFPEYFGDDDMFIKLAVRIFTEIFGVK